MDFQRIQYFLEAAKNNNFSQAAQKFFITPQALSKQISILEEEIGLELFERKGRKVKINENGKFVAEKLGSINDHYEMIIKDINEYIKNKKHIVKIGFFSGLSKEKIVHPLVNLIISYFPQYIIELTIEDIPEIFKLFEEEKIDICITNVHEQENMEKYNKIIFSEHKAMVAVSFYHPWTVKEKITLEDMKKEKFIATVSDKKRYAVTEAENFYMSVPCKEKNEVANFETLRIRLEQGEGFAVIPQAFSDVETSRLKFFEYPSESIKYETVALYRKQDLKPEIRQVTDIINEEFSINM